DQVALTAFVRNVTDDDTIQSAQRQVDPGNPEGFAPGRAIVAYLPEPRTFGADLGTKTVCPSCESKFYDLNKRPATCPKCGHTFDPADETAQATKTKVRTAAAKEAVPEDEDEELEDEEVAKAATAAPDEDEEESSEDQAKELGGDENEVVLEMSGGDDDDDAGPGKIPAGFSEDGVDDDDDDDDEEEINLDEEFDLGTDIDLDDNNELGEPDADDIEPQKDDK
ncbi:MAG: TIGR02300 family protein, partial [Pseudomonadota bacterium]